MATLTGNDVRSIRNALGLTMAQFAHVLGVHPSTVQRWELTGANRVTVEGVPLTVLTALRARVLEQANGLRAAANAGQDVSTKLATGGVLLALTVLLLFAAGEKG
jgi:transcriptional regulator with XRE-family HTH domain